MDLWATVPYYTAYLSRALLAAGVEVQVGSITYYLDRDCFRARGLRLEPGALDVVGQLDLPRLWRRLLKLLEGVANLLALSLRFAVRPPGVVHVQFLALVAVAAADRSLVCAALPVAWGAVGVDGP